MKLIDPLRVIRQAILKKQRELGNILLHFINDLRSVGKGRADKGESRATAGKAEGPRRELGADRGAIPGQRGGCDESSAGAHAAPRPPVLEAAGLRAQAGWLALPRPPGHVDAASAPACPSVCLCPTLFL